MRNAKSNTKRAGQPPNFWGNYQDKVPKEQKENIIKQYFSQNMLFIYTDMSMRIDRGMMAVACTYVSSGTVMVKHQIVHPPFGCKQINVYGELVAIQFAFNQFLKHVGDCNSVTIYSDVRDINEILNQTIMFKRNPSLKQLQEKLILLYQKKKEQYPNLSVQYLTSDQKAHNPFYKASHNASRKLLGL
ncbi:hypothetical protein V7124_19875 [Neobacillus niacini]|uniref:hypothetical protein n=1 Tax=Neobacillus niacini TaxID=86668 RepID=UPI002FFE5466